MVDELVWYFGWRGEKMTMCDSLFRSDLRISELSPLKELKVREVESASFF